MRLTASHIASLPTTLPKRKYYVCEETPGFTLLVDRKGQRLFDVYLNPITKKKERIFLGKIEDVALEDARKLCEQRKALLGSRGRVYYNVPLEGSEELTETLAQTVQSYTVHHIASLKPSSQRLYTLIMERVELRYNTLAEITPRSVRNWADELSRTPVMANRTITILSNLLKYAFERGLVETNACAGISRYKEKPKARTFSEPDIGSFSKSLYFSWASEPVHLAIKILFATGARSSEVMGMKSQEIEENRWVIPADRTKSGRSQLYHLPDVLLTDIERFKANEVGPVFAINGDAVRQAMVRMCKVAEIEPKTPHDCRRTVGTLLAKQGTPPDIRYRFLGHAASSVGDRFYNEYDYADEKLVAARKLWSKLDKLGILQPAP